MRGLPIALIIAAGCADDGGPELTSSSTGSTGTGTASTTDPDSTTSGESSTGVGDPLFPDPGEARYALVGETVVLDGSGSTGALEYSWNFDDGSEPTVPGADPTASVVYDEPGRYHAVLTVFDEVGNDLSASVTISVTLEPIHEPRHSSTITHLGDIAGIALVSPDSDELVVIGEEMNSYAVRDRFDTCANPRTLVMVGSQAAVTCQDSDEVRLHDLSGGASQSVALPRASRPFGVVARGDRLFVSLAATGRLAEVDISQAMPVLVQEHDAIGDARGVAVLPDGRIAVSRWRSPDDEGQIALVDPDSGDVEVIALAFDPKDASDTEAGGVPTYLNQILVSPVADVIAIPSTQANIEQGEFVDGNALTFETTLRGVVSFFEVGSLQEDFDARKHFDNRGLLSSGVFSSRGDYLFMTGRGSRAVERFDVLGSAQSGTLTDVGFAPDGVALSPDDTILFVDAFMSREVVIYDVSDLAMAPEPIARLPIVAAEPLPAEQLLGKQLFNDSFDPRIAKDQYIACAHCHLDGEADRRTWDFTDRGEGIRNTITLLGRGGTDHGPIHWSANFDEVQDFEHDIRGPFGGTGLMTDDEFNQGTRNETLGDAKAGVSTDLDALAAYVESLTAYPRSPFRTEAGDLSAEAQAGQAIFESAEAGCTTCHSGPTLTDSVFQAPADPLLHDVGTITAASGQRLGGNLPGLDTPTLHALWNSPPYLHDGSAAAVRDVLTGSNPTDAHGMTSQLSAQQLDELVAYLLSFEG